MRQAPLIKFVDLAKQEEAIAGRISAAVSKTVGRREFILGPALKAFEAHFASYIGARFAVGTGSGGAALTIALKALGVGPGDEVVTQPNSHISTALAAMYLGARPVFVDVDARTFQLDPAKLEAALTPRTKAVVPVHIFGYAAPMKEISDIAARRGIPVVEDAAHAHGTRYGGRLCGGLGRAGAFSFYPGKILGGWGDGGMIVTDDEELAQAAVLLRSYGDGVKNLHTEVGLNSRLDNLQAAVLDVKLKSLERFVRRRRRAAAWYCRWFKKSGLEGCVVLPPLEIPGQVPAFHIFAVRVPAAQRDALCEHLLARGIEAGYHYPRPIHLQPVMAPLGRRRGDFPVAEELADTMLSLPMYAGLSEKQCRRVVGTVKEFFDARRR